MIVRGGFGEPYCSQECHDKGGEYIAAVMLKKQTGVCGICQKPVQASMYGASNCSVVPYEGVNLFICDRCTTQGKLHLQNYQKCCMCQKPLSGKTPVYHAASHAEQRAPEQMPIAEPPHPAPVAPAQTQTATSTPESTTPDPMTPANSTSAPERVVSSERAAAPRKKSNKVIIAVVVGIVLVCVVVPICLITGITVLNLALSNAPIGSNTDPRTFPTMPPIPMSTYPVPVATYPIPTPPVFYGPPTEPVRAVVPNVNWQRITTLPRQINSFAVDPSNPQVVYAATGENGSGSGVYKSEDRGKTWRNASKGLPNEDAAALAFSRTAPFTLFAIVGVRGDIYASSDNAASWTRIGNTGLFAGFQHQLVTSPSNRNGLFALALASGMARSNDGGRSWTAIRSGIPADEHTVFVQSLAFDPSNANVMYLGTGGFVGGGAGVFKSTDGGTNWSPANQGMLDYRITGLAVDPKLPQTIYAGSDAGEFFKSSDGAQTWQDLTAKLGLPKGQHSGIRRIMVDPNASGTVYLLCDYVGVLVSRDGGTTWSSFGKPPEGESFYQHSAAAVLFGDSPVILLGQERSGAWAASAP